VNRVLGTFNTPKKNPINQAKKLIELQDVSVRFGDLQALQKLSISVNQGDVVFLTGPTGAGKTTLLRVMAGDQEASSGQAIFQTKKIGKIFQDLRLLEDFTLEQNLFFAYEAKNYRNKNQFYDQMMEYAAAVGARDILHKKLSEMNGGMKQKIAFVRALLTKPDIILADEPTSSLDYQSSKRLFDILNYLNTKEGLTIIWATHNRELIKNFTGKILHIEKGKFVHMGNACFI
jgi:ABC-type multidrug transport system ATPase subunit